MPVHVISLVRSEDSVDVIGEALGGIDHLRLTGQILMLHRHFEEVAGIVHLVLQLKIIPAFVESVHDEPGDEKSILLLGCEDAINDAVHPFL